MRRIVISILTFAGVGAMPTVFEAVDEQTMLPPASSVWPAPVISRPTLKVIRLSVASEDTSTMQAAISCDGVALAVANGEPFFTYISDTNLPPKTLKAAMDRSACAPR